MNLRGVVPRYHRRCKFLRCPLPTFVGSLRYENVLQIRYSYISSNFSYVAACCIAEIFLLAEIYSTLVAYNSIDSLENPRAYETNGEEKGQESQNLQTWKHGTETSNTALKSSEGPRPISSSPYRRKEKRGKGYRRGFGLTKSTNLFICMSRRVRLNLVLPAERKRHDDIPSQNHSSRCSQYLPVSKHKQWYRPNKQTNKQTNTWIRKGLDSEMKRVDIDGNQTRPSLSRK